MRPSGAAAPTPATARKRMRLTPGSSSRGDKPTSGALALVVGAGEGGGGPSPPLTLARPSAPPCACAVLRSENAALRAEAEHSEARRRLDARKSEQDRDRLRRQIEFLTEEAEDARRMAEEVQEATERDVERMRGARTEAIERLREAEARAARMEQVAHLSDEGALELEKNKREMLEERVEAMQKEAKMLRERLEDAERRAAEAEKRAAIAESRNDGDSAGVFGADIGAKGKPAPPESPERPRPRSGSGKSPISPAPPALMSELNRVRIKLAESECHGRQLARKVDALQKIADESVQNRESAHRAESRAQRMEQQLRSLQREREAARETETMWTDFRKEIRGFFDDEPAGFGGLSEEDDPRGNIPPEVGAVLRNFNSLKRKVEHLKEEKALVESQMDSGQRRVKALEAKLNEAYSSQDNWQSERKDLETKVKETDTELKKLKAQESIWQREADSLRCLLETFENTQEAGGRKSRVATTSSLAPGESVSPTVCGLQLGLTSARDQIRILEEEAEKVSKERDAARDEVKEIQTEHKRVLEKFGKLRDALFKEREKAEKAEERAAQAETLVGKGHYNDETTRVLHLKENPMMMAVREKFQKEIDSLKTMLVERDAEIAAASGHDSTSTRTPPSAGSASSRGERLSNLDAQKLHKRLKESFKEQIALFREGVYLITGYKIDMFADLDRPRFRVRSMYSDREDDHLMFLWPKTKKGQEGSVSGLDLLDTEMAQMLTKSHSFDYMTRYKSMPGFMASVQLSLFETLTCVG